MAYQLIRKKDITANRKTSISSLNREIEDEIFPPAFKISGGRSSAWFEYELKTMNAARAAGKNKEEIKRLVKVLVGKRQEKFADILASLEIDEY
jgi:predicted DNA-binding transcriptional regulator AlpA